MKFGHIADCHVGGWREEELRVLGIKSLEKAADICIEEHIAFLLISGDLFNTSMPQIEMIKGVTAIFNRLREHDIAIYIIPGSHDYSPSGKTMLDVLEHAGLVVNVMKFEKDKLQFTEDKTGVKITGLYGRRNSLERLDYAHLEKEHLEKEKGIKIFMFHTTLEEFKPKDFEKIEGESYTSMPRGFNYYAGGHVHYLFDIEKEGFGKIVYPGPLFPNNFKELEEIKHGNICIIDDKFDLRRIPIVLKEVESFHIDITGKEPEEARKFIGEELKKKNLKDKIVTLRIFGELESGKVSDLGLRDIGKNTGAYCLIKNVNKLTSKSYEMKEVKEGSVEEIEASVIKEQAGKLEFIDTEQLCFNLMNVLAIEKHEGETNADFEKRLLADLLKIVEK